MGGAFVGVADDATATHWNPAGLVAGGPAGMTASWYRSRSTEEDEPTHPGPGRRSGAYTSVATWPVGVSYGSFKLSRLLGTVDGDVRVATLRTSHFGVTILQSIVEGLVVGSTLKYVRGGVVSSASQDETVGDAFERADDLEGDRSGAFDLDVGVMFDMRRLRVGLTWKNLTSPTFDDVATTAITLPRQTRLGVGIFPVDGLTFAMDIDLETVDFQGDARRTFALGGEAELGGRFAVRSGVRWSLEGASRLIGAAGVSFGLRPGLWLDGHYSQSRHDEDREFGVAMRAGL
jgi:hypothetical protein